MSGIWFKNSQGSPQATATAVCHFRKCLIHSVDLDGNGYRRLFFFLVPTQRTIYACGPMDLLLDLQSQSTYKLR